METRFLSPSGTSHIAKCGALQIAKSGVLQVSRIDALQIAKNGAVQVTNYTTSIFPLPNNNHSAFKSVKWLHIKTQFSELMESPLSRKPFDKPVNL